MGSRESGEERDGLGSEAEEKPLRRGQCRSYLERAVREEFRKIVQGFLKEAKKGGCAHMKFAAELVEPAKGPKRRGKGSAQRMLEKIGK